MVRIAVLNDQSGLYADLGGPGSVTAARMAVEDAGGTVLGKPVEIVFADHQNKSDIGVAVARQWFDVGKVDMAIGFDNSSVALAVEQLAAERNRIAIAGAVGSTAFTGKACTANEASWIYDSYALTTSLAKSTVAEGRDTRFFITVDYAFGHSLEADANAAVQAAGGKVLGSVRHPLNTSDFSSYLLQAQASGAKVVAFANGGGDMVNALKQANEFGLTKTQSMVALLIFISDVHSMELRAAQGLKFVTAFHWDRDDDSRAWSKRFFEKQGRIPTMAQASVYSAVRHYLIAITAAGTDEAKAVMAKMRAILVNDFYVKNGLLREDGRLVHDMYFSVAGDRIAAYIQIARLGGAEIGVALMGTWLRVREQIHSNYLGLHLENGSGEVTRMLGKLTDFFASQGVGTAPARAIGTLSAQVAREANTLAYIDGFWLCFWLAMTALLLVALMTRAPPGPFTPTPFGFAKGVLRKCGVTVS